MKLEYISDEVGGTREDSPIGLTTRVGDGRVFAVHDDAPFGGAVGSRLNDACELAVEGSATHVRCKGIGRVKLAKPSFLNITIKYVHGFRVSLNAFVVYDYIGAQLIETEW